MELGREEMNITNGQAGSTVLGFKNAPVFTLSIGITMGAVSQAFGGMTLKGKPVEGFHPIGYLESIMIVFGVKCWEDIYGKFCRCLADPGRMYSIGHLIEDKWLHPNGIVVPFTELPEEMRV